jgi:hypothetical protein
VKRSLAYALTAVCVLAVGATPPAMSSSRAAGSNTHVNGSGSFAFGVGLDQVSGLNVNVSVQVGVTTFRPHALGSSLVTLDTQTLFASFDSPTPDGFGDAFGCWVIPTSDFVVNSDLSATLTFDSTDLQVSECPGDPVGPTGLSTPGLVVNLTGPVVLNVTWVPTSPIVSTQSISRESCRPNFDTSVGSAISADALPSGTTSGTFESPADPFGGSFQGLFGGVEVGTGHTEFTGFPGICGPGP